MAKQHYDGPHWEVFVEWTGREALTPLSHKSLSARRARYRERAANSDSGLADGCDAGADFDLGGIVIGIVVVLVVIAVWPIIAPVGAAIAIVAVAIVEVTIIVFVAALAILARTLLGRPWRVLSINQQGETWSWKQVGWGEAHRLVDRIQAELDAGAQPDRVAPGSSTPEGRSQLRNDVGTGLITKTWLRVTSKLIVVVLTLVAIYRILVAIYG